MGCKGRSHKGEHPEAQSTDAYERDGLLRSSDEVLVMRVDRRGQIVYVFHIKQL